jgi:hypothetical protein
LNSDLAVYNAHGDRKRTCTSENMPILIDYFLLLIDFNLIFSHFFTWVYLMLREANDTYSQI